MLAIRRIAHASFRLRATGIIASFVAFSLSIGCTGPMNGSPVAIIYERTSRTIDRAIFLKPERNGTSEDDHAMAPLVAAPCSDPCEEPPWIGSAGRTIYVGEATALVGDDAFEQRIYVWLYGDGEKPDRLAAQGIRMTLDDDGFPFIWEVLADTGGRRVVYVTQWLEDKAARQFSQPLPKRRFAIEPSANETDVVVARALDGGPMPMGPWVYLERESRNVTTLLCRCSNSQIGGIERSEYYEMVPIERLREQSVRLSEWESRCVFNADGSDDPRLLERVLRWPALR